MTIPMNTIEGRKAWMDSHESGLYSGKDVDGKEVQVYHTKGKGMTVKTQNKEGWWSCIDYDAEGNREDEYLESAKGDEKK